MTAKKGCYYQAFHSFHNKNVSTFGINSKTTAALMNEGSVSGCISNVKVKKPQILSSDCQTFPLSVFDLADATWISRCGWTGLGFAPSMPFSRCVCSHSHGFWNHTAVETDHMQFTAGAQAFLLSHRCSPLSPRPCTQHCPSCPVSPLGRWNECTRGFWCWGSTCS